MEFTIVRYAVHPAEQGRIAQLDGISNHISNHLPKVGERMTHPYLVDPKARTPVSVFVSRVITDYSPEFVVVVVSRPQ